MPSSQSTADAEFCIAVLGPEGVANHRPGSLVHNYLRMRALVYIDQRAILDESHRRLDGTELDIDDSRSTHLVATDGQHVIGCLRLPVKSVQADRPLPIERTFPNCFRRPLDYGAVEVSRLIVVAGDQQSRRRVKVALITLALACIIDQELGPVCAVLEKPLQRDLEELGVPMSVVAGPEHIAAYRSVNVGVAIDHKAFRDQLGPGALDNLKTHHGAINPFGPVRPRRP